MKNNTMKIVIGGHGCMLQISHRSVTLELYVFIYIVSKKHMTNDLILPNVKEHNSITKIRSIIDFAKIFYMIIMTYETIDQSLISTIYKH